MPFKDLSHLIVASPVHQQPPDAEPRFVTRLAEKHYEKYLGEGKDLVEVAFGARWRGSWSGLCSRALQYNLAGLAPTEPPSIADAWRFGLGTMVHEQLQDTIKEAFPDAYIELEIKAETWGGIHADALICQPGPYQPPDLDPRLMEKRTLLEIKTINGFGFKRAVGARGQAQGPRANAVIQACMAGKYAGATEAVIGYLSMELLSPREAYKLGASEVLRFAAEWTIPHHTMLRIADDETARIKAIMKVGGEDVVPRSIPDPEIPDGATIVDPHKGTWHRVIDGIIEDAGTTWHCGYCPHQSRCADDGA